MKKRLAALLVLAAFYVGAQRAPRPAIFGQIEEILSDLGRITGLKAPKTVAADVIDKNGLQRFLEKRIEETLEEEDIRAEEITLKLLGFLPAGFDLKKMTVDLLTEQAAAFYDFRKKKLFLMEATPALSEQTLLVHELAHAVADYNFRLERYIQKGKNDDAALARQAVMEGQATWLMAEYLAQRMGQTLKTSPEILDMMERQTGASNGMFPVFDQAPLYLRESLLFPYTRGLRFQHAVIERLGQAGFAEVFRKPPVSTQQVIDPKKYFDGVEPTDPPLPSIRGGRAYRELASGALGEFDHDLLLRQYAGKEAAAALPPKWRGGKYRVLEHKRNRRTVLLYVADWADEAAAKEYFALYRKVLAGKWKKLEVAAESESRIEGRGDPGAFRTAREGSRVASVEGL